MAYYGGAGDYYRPVGDPGLFDFLKPIAKTIVGAVTGGPVGAVVGAVQGFGSLTSSRARQAALAAGPSGTALTPVLLARHAAVLKRGRGVGQPIGIMAPGGGLPRKRGAHIPGLGKRRHMNVANVKALHRSVRRLAGFEHLYAKVWKSLHKVAMKGPRRRAPAPRALAPVPMHRRLGRGDGLGFVGDFYQGDM